LGNVLCAHILVCVSVDMNMDIGIGARYKLKDFTDRITIQKF
jgi:hypothetical protein